MQLALVGAEAEPEPTSTPAAIKAAMNLCLCEPCALAEPLADSRSVAS